MTVRDSGEKPLGWKEEYEGRVEVHNSDVTTFLRCRRRWNWSSLLRQGLEPADQQSGPLWFGTGWHFALEDFHGYRKFKTPSEAFMAYVNAFDRDSLPSDYADLFSLGIGMFDYYTRHWLPRRNTYETYWLDGKPQVEIDFVIPIPGTDALYGGTFDRIVIDQEKRLYVLDYKTAARFEPEKWSIDPQITRYTWAASELYGLPFEGCVWQQHLKAVPERPVTLKTGKLSQSKSQHTTYALYRAELIERFGKVPDEYVDFVNDLIEAETEAGDRYIRRDMAYRNEMSLLSEANEMGDIARDMLDPSIPLYKNPTRDCSWECAFKTPCMTLDDGGDAEYLIETLYRPRAELRGWRERIKWSDGTIGSGATTNVSSRATEEKDIYEWLEA